MNYRETRRPRECRAVGCHRPVIGASAFCKEHYLEWRNTSAAWDAWPDLSKIKRQK